MSYFDDVYEKVIGDCNVVNGEEYKAMVMAIAKVASDTVKATLGPYGSTTVVDEGNGFIYPTKDGWACLSKLQFTDPTHNTIYNILKKISFNSVTTVGDGSTTAIVAAYHFLDLFSKYDFNKNVEFRQADFIEEFKDFAKDLEEELRKNENIIKINPEGDYKDIYNVAYISTNGNDKFSEIIQNIYKITNNPNIQVKMEKIPETTYEIQKGYKFDARVLNYPVYVNDDSNIINYKDHPCNVIIFNHNVNYQSHKTLIEGISNIASKANHDILILAPYFDDIITSIIDRLVQKMYQENQVPNIMLIQTANALGQRVTLNDLAVLTNTTIFDETKLKIFNMLVHNQTHGKDEKLEDETLGVTADSDTQPIDIIMSSIGTIRSIVINKNEAFLQDYDTIANKNKYEDIMREAEEDYRNAKEKSLKTIAGTLDKDYLFKQMRYIKLKGLMGVIKVGGLSDIEQRCDKDAIDDAVLACKSAYENGIVRGLNLEILSIIKNIYGYEYNPYNKYESSNIIDHDFFINDDEKLPGKIKCDYFEGMFTLNDKLYNYYQDICHLIAGCFYETTLDVLANKEPDNTRDREVHLHSKDYIDKKISRLSNINIIDTAIQHKNVYDYDLVTDELNPMNHWKVVTSTETDIEILKAVVNILVTIITSNQFISLTRRYDPVSNDKKRLESRLEEDTKILENKITTIMKSVGSALINLTNK